MLIQPDLPIIKTLRLFLILTALGQILDFVGGFLIIPMYAGQHQYNDAVRLVSNMAWALLLMSHVVLLAPFAHNGPREFCKPSQLSPHQRWQCGLGLWGALGLCLLLTGSNQVTAYNLTFIDLMALDAMVVFIALAFIARIADQRQDRTLMGFSLTTLFCLCAGSASLFSDIQSNPIAIVFAGTFGAMGLWRAFNILALLEKRISGDKADCEESETVVGL